LLPTFISDNELDSAIDGIKSSSRRSLRPDKLKSPETISRDEFTIVSPLLSSNKTEEISKRHEAENSMREEDEEEKRSTQLPDRCRMASEETLNTSEKVSSNADFDLSSTMNLSIDERTLLPACSDENFMTCRRSGMHGSRYSLNETVYAKPSLVENFKDDFRRSFRGNSLNIVYEHEIFQPAYQSSPTKHVPCVGNGNVSDIVISMKNRPKRQHRNKQISTTMPVTGNLKRNPSLRYSNYLKNMRVHRNSIHYRGAMLNTHRYRLKASSCPNIFRNSITSIAKEDTVSTFSCEFSINLF
jgi:hypothetical protein